MFKMSQSIHSYKWLLLIHRPKLQFSIPVSVWLQTNKSLNCPRRVCRRHLAVPLSRSPLLILQSLHRNKQHFPPRDMSSLAKCHTLKSWLQQPISTTLQYLQHCLSLISHHRVYILLKHSALLLWQNALEG